MAKYEDYVKRNQAGGLDAEIDDAAVQKQARQDDATPAINWEERYKELEKLNSRQAQTLGEYRKTIDEYILNPTPARPEVEEESQPITVDDLYDDADGAVRRTVDSHPAIREARKFMEEQEKRTQQERYQAFVDKHSDYQDLVADPEFANWVQEDGTRVDLATRANQYDLSAADALFSLYKAEKGLTEAQKARQRQEELDAASLEDSSAMMPSNPQRFSRSEYVDKLTRAKQGDLEAETWVKRNAPKYREALMNGQVRD